jgi:hypothetical protein
MDTNKAFPASIGIWVSVRAAGIDDRTFAENCRKQWEKLAVRMLF